MIEGAVTGVREAPSQRGRATELWRAYFQNWPAGVPPRGVLVSSFDEQIPFSSFMVSDELLYLERRTPDTLGARAIILPFASIAALKITDVIESRDLRALGFASVAPAKTSKSAQAAPAR